MIMHGKSVLECGRGVGVRKGGWGGICGCACTSVELKHSFPLKLRINEFKQHTHLKQNIGNLRRLCPSVGCSGDDLLIEIFLKTAAS